MNFYTAMTYFQNLFLQLNRWVFGLLISVSISISLNAQVIDLPYLGTDAPPYLVALAQNMHQYAFIDSLYTHYYLNHPFEKNTYTQFYKRWKRWARPYLQSNGTLRIPSLEEQDQLDAEKIQQRQASRNLGGGNWTFVGPKQTFDTDGKQEVTWQTNIYSLDIADSNPDILYAGGESGGLWKTENNGLNWTLCTRDIPHGAIGAVEIHPWNPDTVFFGTQGRIYKSNDGGGSWTSVYAANNIWVNQFLMDSLYPNIIFAACDQGLLKSVDGGTNWTTVNTNRTWTIIQRPGHPETIFTVQKVNNSSECRRSTNYGLTWTAMNTGWYIPSSDQTIDGVILAPCPSNNNKMYAYLNGTGPTLNGYVGVWVTNNNGSSWTNTNTGNLVGNTPTAYTIPTHTNLMSNNGIMSGFNQGFYDMAIVVNPANENEIIAGGTSWWKSTDGGKNWNGLGGYVGTLGWSHPDIQWCAAKGNRLWIASDGGLNYSTDFGKTHVARMNGISGSDMWGYGNGWNEDVIVGGRYHNGNMGRHESFPEGKFYRLGGAEAATGYVNPGDATLTYHSDLGGKKILPGWGNGVTSFATELFPNESYAYYANSEMTWDPRCWNHVYLGNKNNLWKSIDGGGNYDLVYAFPGGEDKIVFEIEIYRPNPNILYITQWDGTDDVVWKSEDAGVTWKKCTPLPLPNNNDRLKLALSDQNPNHLWVGVTYGSNGKKVYRSLDGGVTWINYTTATLNNCTVSAILPQYGTDGGVYLGTNKGIFYRNNQHSDWQPFSNGLPVSVEPNRILPFYKNGKVRVGCWGFGVWESDCFEISNSQARAMCSNLNPGCTRDTVYFDDYSAVNHANAKWKWSIQPAPQYMSDSNQRRMKAVFGATGNYQVVMQLNDSLTSNLSIQVDQLCNADTIPGLAMQIDGNDSPGYASVPALNIKTNQITFTAWVKPDGIQPEYSSILMHEGEAAGFNFLPGNNHLGYHWPGGAWWWDSGLQVPANQWNHVAMVVQPTGITLYLNGVGVKHAFTVDSLLFQDILRIGSYKGWEGRYVKGMIDEFCVFNQSLTETEIRLLMHLTKDPSQFPSLIRYYQFNEPDSRLYDKVGSAHGTSSGSAVRIKSRLPAGKGVSEIIDIKSTDTNVFFQSPGVHMQFGANSSKPNGKVCVTRINQSPDEIPSPYTNHGNTYWVINNYSTNKFITPLSIFQFDGIDQQKVTLPKRYRLYHRETIDEGNFWTIQDTCDATTFTDKTNVFFHQNSDYIDEQYIIVKEDDTTADPPLSHSSEDYWGMYPNPIKVSSQLYISPASLESYTLSCYDAAGRHVYESKQLQGKQSFHLPLLAGTYQLHIRNSKKLQIKTLIIE